MDEFEDDFEIFDDDAADYAVLEEEEKKNGSGKGTGCLGILIILTAVACVFIWLI